MIDLIFIFSIYSILGWITEVIYFMIKTGKLQKRGILNGAYCPLYGFSITVSTIIITKLNTNIIFSFLICSIICTTFELITGIIFDKILHHKMWDYCNIKNNIKGYICLPFSIIWGITALSCIKLFNPILLSISLTIKTIFSISIILFMCLDIISKIKNRKMHHN